MRTENAKENFLGVLLTLTGGILWGFSGACGQFLFTRKAVVSTWLVPVRLLTAGVLMLLYLILTRGKRIFAIWKDARDVRDLLLFGFFGMTGCQFCYFTAIQYSNAGTATVLQYLGPALILVWICLRGKRRPTAVECVALALALTGALLLATHGSLHALALSPQGLFWGLLSALFLAVYTLAPIRLLTVYDSVEIVGWGMLIGGVVLCAVFRPWETAVPVDPGLLGGMAGVILLGSIAAFTLYFSGVRRIGPGKGSMISAIEPVAAAVFGVLWLGNTMTGMDLAGFACILTMVVLLARSKS